MEQKQRYKSLVTGTRARGVIAVLWVLAFGIGLTPFLGWNSKDSATNNCTEPWDGTTNESCCLVKCLFENVVPMSYMVYFNFFGCVLPPLLIMLVIYIKIFMVACRQLQRTELMDHSRTILQREIHAAKSLALIVGIFALCWLPVHAINCVTLFQPAQGKEKPKWAMNTAILLSHANSVVNPIVYAYRNRDFRYTFHKIISRNNLGESHKSLSRISSDNNFVTANNVFLNLTAVKRGFPILTSRLSLFRSTEKEVWPLNHTTKEHGGARARARGRGPNPAPAGRNPGLSPPARRGESAAHDAATHALRPVLRALSRTAAAISLRSSSTTAGNVTAGKATAMALTGGGLLRRTSRRDAATDARGIAAASRGGARRGDVTCVIAQAGGDDDASYQSGGSWAPGSGRPALRPGLQCAEDAA
ncbi:hypothetical protein HPG69_015906 [Diceros bicornis minor]|uniref:Adenosine receptor A2 n=1 Tax=Diceros bicornis minor TaxID=77932 RepID=A0A7J7E871_DICBM|nr:hypothetical protein HPG69_015906 [Diceros bicornis minor]